MTVLREGRKAVMLQVDSHIAPVAGGRSWLSGKARRGSPARPINEAA
jgi:hypothetical protein